MHFAFADHLSPSINLLVRGLSHLLVPMFLVGMAGSSLVVVITVMHDMVDFFSDEGDNDMPTADNMKAS